MTASIRRISILIAKEFAHGHRSFIVIFAVVIPVVLSLMISLLAGSLFSGKPRLGIADAGSSALPGRLASLDYLVTRTYDDAPALRRDVERGALDLGIVLVPGFDAALRSGDTAEMRLYLWGESLLKHRTLLQITLSREVIALAGHASPVTTVVTLLGDGAGVPWDVRLFPLVMSMTIILGGTMIPATSIVDEKQKRTLTALTVTPVSLGEVIAAKGITGALISVVMGLAILALNRAFGPYPLMMVGLLVLGSAFSAALGVILGLLTHDITTLFATLKGLGLLLYAPAITYLFPQLPSWVSRIFPTYYIIGPIIDLSLQGATPADIAPDLAILAVLVLAAIAAAARLTKT